MALHTVATNDSEVISLYLSGFGKLLIAAKQIWDSRSLFGKVSHF